MPPIHDIDPAGVPGGAREARISEAERLVREFNGTLVRMLQIRLGSPEDAREVAQEAYARLLNLGDDRAVGFHRALLFRIAQNLATDLLRRRAHMEQPQAEGLDLWPDPAADPERSARARAVLDRLPGVLAELPPKCAEAFRLVRIAHLDFAEAAARLGIGERMVRLHVVRALAHCQARLQEMDEGEEGP